MEQNVDVVVVGAGLAGLRAALDLQRAGRSVLVLEARDRVGGRTWSGELEGAEVDWGGEWIGEGQPRIYAMVEELGLRTFPTWDKGRKVLEVGGRVSTYTGLIPLMAPWKLVQIQVGIWILDAMARKLDPDEPWAHPRAAAWDGVTLDGFRRRVMWSADARAVMDAAFRTIFGAESGDISLFHALCYIRSAGSLEKLIATEGGFQHDRIVGGAQAISEAAAERLGASALQLSTPVVSIVQEGADVVVRTPSDAVRCRRVIVATTVPAAGRIAYEPPVPASRDQLTQRAPMGAAVKCFVRYERAFWRDAGLSGEAASGDGPISVTFDQCSEDGSQACLLAFVGGAHARTWHERDPEERKRVVLEKLARYFGDEALTPSSYAEVDWAAERWSGGGPVSVFSPGALSVQGAALRRPFGRVHWAGTESARLCMGFMEGAVESGERAAAEVDAALAEAAG